MPNKCVKYSFHLLQMNQQIINAKSSTSFQEPLETRFAAPKTELVNPKGMFFHKAIHHLQFIETQFKRNLNQQKKLLNKMITQSSFLEKPKARLPREEEIKPIKLTTNEQKALQDILEVFLGQGKGDLSLKQLIQKARLKLQKKEPQPNLLAPQNEQKAIAQQKSSIIRDAKRNDLIRSQEKGLSQASKSCLDMKKKKEKKSLEEKQQECKINEFCLLQDELKENTRQQTKDNFFYLKESSKDQNLLISQISFNLSQSNSDHLRQNSKQFLLQNCANISPIASQRSLQLIAPDLQPETKDKNKKQQSEVVGLSFTHNAKRRTSKYIPKRQNQQKNMNDRVGQNCKQANKNRASFEKTLEKGHKKRYSMYQNVEGKFFF